MLKRTLLFSLLVFGTCAFADDIKTVETCKIEESIELDTATQIICDGDLMIGDGVEIVTHGHGLQIAAFGAIHFGSENGLGLLISANEGPAGQIFVSSTLTATGHLKIDNQGEPATSFGGDIEIQYGSSHNYSQVIHPGRAAELRMVIGDVR